MTLNRPFATWIALALLALLLAPGAQAQLELTFELTPLPGMHLTGHADGAVNGPIVGERLPVREGPPWRLAIEADDPERSLVLLVRIFVLSAGGVRLEGRVSEGYLEGALVEGVAQQTGAGLLAMRGVLRFRLMHRSGAEQRRALDLGRGGVRAPIVSATRFLTASTRSVGQSRGERSVP